MSTLGVKLWSARSVQREPTASAVVCASITGINYPLDLRVASQMSIIKAMDMTVNIFKQHLEPTVQSKLRLLKHYVIPKNIHTSPKDGSLVWTFPPPRTSS